MFLDFLWKKRKFSRYQSVVLGDSDEHLMTLPDGTADWVVKKVNELNARIGTLTSERDSALRTVRSRNEALRKVLEFIRPFVHDNYALGGIPRRVYDIVISELPA